MTSRPLHAPQKTVVVTGANSGIGFELAAHFAGRGARVVMACRKLDKGAEAERRLLARTPEAQTRVLPLDLSELESIRAFAEACAAEVGEIDLLINNAGIAGFPLERNAAGFELHLATNYLGPFALTGLLLPQLCAERQARIVNVGSLAHRFGALELAKLNWEAGRYDHWKAYANSKLALLAFTMELDRRLRARGARHIALAAHPGFANTNMGENNPALREWGPVRRWFQGKVAPLVPSAAEGARPVILAAEGEAVRGGDYYGPRGPFEIQGRPGRARLNPAVTDAELRRALWSKSESMTGLRYLSDP